MQVHSFYSHYSLISHRLHLNIFLAWIPIKKTSNYVLIRLSCMPFTIAEKKLVQFRRYRFPPNFSTLIRYLFEDYHQCWRNENRIHIGGYTLGSGDLFTWPCCTRGWRVNVKVILCHYQYIMKTNRGIFTGWSIRNQPEGGQGSPSAK